MKMQVKSNVLYLITTGIVILNLVSELSFKIRNTYMNTCVTGSSIVILYSWLDLRFSLPLASVLAN